MSHPAESLPTIALGPLTNGDSIQPSTSSETLEGISASSGHNRNDSGSFSRPPLPEADDLQEENQHVLKPLLGYTRYLREIKYVLYVESLVQRHPSLRTVLSYMKVGGSAKNEDCEEKGDCLQYQYFTVINMKYIAGKRCSFSVLSRYGLMIRRSHFGRLRHGINYGSCLGL